jgi:ABC-2 type transport system ATP-binding protein
MTAGVAVHVARVGKRYGDHVAVSDLSFDVRAGTVFGLLGPNGAGKTTTIRMLNDIVRPDTGEIALFGTLAPGLKAARRIGYLPEERGLYPKMKVREALGFFGELRGLAHKEARHRADVWLDRLGLSAWQGHPVQDLSKGMQQKVQFISAVLHDPDLLILDEPWSGLDPLNADVLYEIVLAEKKRGKTIVFSTHLMDQAERVCDEVSILSQGRKILEGPVAALKRAARRERLCVVSFVTDEDHARAQPILDDPSLVVTTTATSTHLVLELAGDGSAQPLLVRLASAHASLRRFELLEPSLHQIFVDEITLAQAKT